MDPDLNRAQRRSAFLRPFLPQLLMLHSHWMVGFVEGLLYIEGRMVDSQVDTGKADRGLDIGRLGLPREAFVPVVEGEPHRYILAADST